MVREGGKIEELGESEYTRKTILLFLSSVQRKKKRFRKITEEVKIKVILLNSIAQIKHNKHLHII